jgi:hypothetical protein
MAQDGDADVRVVHASPDTPPVDVFVDGARAIEGLEFGTATDFVSLPAGEYDVDVAASGADIEDAVISATLELEAGVRYDVAAVGLLADISALVSVVDADLLGSRRGSRPRRPRRAGCPGGRPRRRRWDVLFADLEFPGAGPYAELPAGTYDLEVRPAGSDDVVLPLEGLALTGGTVYDVYAIGLLGDDSFTVLPLTTVAGVHSMPNTGTGALLGEGSTGATAVLLLALAALSAVGGIALRRVRA